MKKCKFCGAEIDDDTKFCPNCGGQQDTEAQTAENNSNEMGRIGKEINDLENGIRNGVNEKPIKGTLLGIILGLFLGIFGLIICLILGDDKCRRAAIICFIINIVLGIISIVFQAMALFSAEETAEMVVFALSLLRL